MKNFSKKHEVTIKYFVYGTIATWMGWSVYFATLALGRIVANIPTSDTVSKTYLVIYTLAQILQWVTTLLFAFFINKKWVFKDEESDKSTKKEFGIFASGRVLTFFLDFAITFFGTYILGVFLPSANQVWFWDKGFNLNEIIAKLISAIFVIIGNYFFCKLIVFNKRS